MCAEPIEFVTQDLADSPVTKYSSPVETMRFYNGRYMVGETIMRSGARVIAKALGGEYLETPP